MIKRLRDLYNAVPKNMVVGIGPVSRKESYIKESPKQIGDPRWQGFLENLGNNKYKVDFVGLCKKQLVEGGVKQENIYDCGIDTVKDKRFFSHYRDKDKDIEKQGRFACVVGTR